MDLTSVRRFHQPAELHLEAKKEWREFIDSPGRPLDLEIGCGVGWHPIRYAGQNAERKLIAIEHTQEKFERFQRRYRQHGCPGNLLPIHANAVTWVNCFLPANCVDQIFLLYPNPNLHNRAKRWMAMPFMGRLLDSLKTGGELTMATNESWYKDEAIRLAETQWGLQLVHQQQIDSQMMDRRGGPRTHFEKKYLERGEVCFDLRWRKNHGGQFCQGDL